ncbi:predicted protein [Chaetoceros tenuissimus]|uniref:ANK_REP_REGION domain-containing protein n=1 Tax=Chaetoceros tenuissimus TaxID=426638 RepID=A0AAD3CEF0_9STRA|nr:predicted protein [Chaetoceros tenuissimus]
MLIKPSLKEHYSLFIHISTHPYSTSMDLFKSKAEREQKKLEKLEKLIKSQKWDALTKLLNTKKGRDIFQYKRPRIEHSSSNDGSKRSLNRKNSFTSGVTPEDLGLDYTCFLLNLCILNGCPLAIVQMLISIDGSLSWQQDRNGMTPLAVCCAARGSDKDIIQYLVRHDMGKGATIQDNNGKTALHHLMNYICYPNPSNLSIWQDQGYTCNFDKKYMSMESNGSLEATSESGASQKLSMTQAEFSNFAVCMNITCKMAAKSMFLRDRYGNTPIDILHECKARCEEEQVQSPKWERADIANIMLRQKLVAYHRAYRKHCEAIGQMSGLNIKDNTSIPSLERSSVNTGSIQSGFTGLSRERDDSLSRNGSGGIDESLLSRMDLD